MVLFVVMVVSWQAFWYYVHKRHMCDCGRQRRWYFSREHTKAWVMLTQVVWFVGAVIYSVIIVDAFGALLWAVVGVYMVRRWWMHEKDRRAGWLGRMAGWRVAVGEGRLRVVRA